MITEFSCFFAPQRSSTEIIAVW